MIMIKNNINCTCAIWNLLRLSTLLIFPSSKKKKNPIPPKGEKILYFESQGEEKATKTLRKWKTKRSILIEGSISKTAEIGDKTSRIAQQFCVQLSDPLSRISLCRLIYSNSERKKHYHIKGTTCKF